MEIMKIVIIEDDILECEKFQKIVNKRNDIELALVTDSDIVALDYFKQNKADGIILDLELSKGSGNGDSFGFLEELNKLKLNTKPKIIVTTNVLSDSVYDFLHSAGVDLVYYKKQANYSQESVLNTFLMLKGFNTSAKKSATIDIPEQNMKENIIKDAINKELDLIGIANHLQGRKYLYDSIYFVLTNEDSNQTVIQHLIKQYKKSSSTISRAMQNAILHAWRISSIDDLEKLYTAKVNYETGVPTPTEFIYYYADKIKKSI